MRLPLRTGARSLGPRGPVLAAIASLSLASVGVGMATHVRQAALARRSSYEATWRSSQAATELGRVVERASAALAGVDGVDAEEVSLRFDVLRNRVALFDLPEYAEFLVTDGEAAAAAAELRAAVAKAEALQGSLEDREALRAFRSDLVPALARASVLAGAAHRYGIDQSEQDRASIATLYMLFAGLVAATLVAVLTLVAIVARQARELERLAHRDPLTGLANRVMLSDRLQGCWAEGPGLAVLCLDLDRFKPVNDEHGHAVGDAVLVAVARRLEALIGAHDMLARVGGDEFVVVSADVAGAASLASRIVGALAPPVRVDGREVRIGTSVGVAVAPADGLTAEALLLAADAALYRAKRAGPDAQGGSPEADAVRLPDRAA